MILDASGVPEMLDGYLPAGGRPRQLSSHAVLLGVMVALDQGRPAHLEAAHRALSGLPFDEQLASGVAVTGNGECDFATYRQLEDTFSVVCRPIDPSPVPSFRGVPEEERTAHLARARAGIDVSSRQAALFKVADALLEASVPELYKSASASLAVDWTDHETWSRPRAKNDTEPANDPDASFGHAKRNAPGAKDCVFYGYYAQVATMIADEGGPRVPELVRRMAFEAPRRDPAGVMAATLSRMATDGTPLGDVVADCGYSYREPTTWARPLRRLGASLVMDLHPKDRGQKGTFEGAICANGQLYCPKTPLALLAIGPLARGARADETAAHDQRCTELARYKLTPVARPDGDGYFRVACPASAGKLRCPLKADSMALPARLPSVLEPLSGELPRCCAQQTITVAVQVNEKTRQKHDYPGAAFRDSYKRRTAAERTYASLCDPSVGGIRRGWCRLFGLAKNTLMYALAVVVRNVRIVESFEAAQAQAARRAALGGTKRRRRRHERDEHPPEEPPPDDPRAQPG
ncbi:MAG: hypothetical protein M3Y22_06310 [Pseudomonadota bacterium]|nr:hypothetical protein [Pseudomonadota bacterium]